MFCGSMPLDPTIADRFAWSLRRLYNALGVEFRRRGIGHPLQTEISVRLTGLVRRLNAVFAKWQAGTLRAAQGRNGTSLRPSAQRGEGDVKRPACAWRGLPHGFGWLKRLLPGAGGEMNAFIAVLDDAEMKAIAATAPQVGRILRPLCHLLGIPTP